MHTAIPAGIKVGFVLLSNARHPMPSTRIAILNMFPFLRQAGFDPHVVFEPAQPTELPDLGGLDLAPRLVAEGFQIVVFQKVGGPSVEALARDLRDAGIRTVYCVCDLIDTRMAALTDATVVVTDFLKSLYPAELRDKVHVVHDGIEHPETFKPGARAGHGSAAAPLRAVLVTSMSLEHLPQIGFPPRWLDVTIVGRYPSSPTAVQRARHAARRLLDSPSNGERLAYLRFLANTRIHCAAWDPVHVYRHMLDADIGIIPVDAVEPPAGDTAVPSWKVKSENRLSMKMCVGLPVVATPIPSYLPLIRQGENGFFARTRAEWREHLDSLRDPRVRDRVGQAARASVLQRYSMEEQGRLLSNVLSSLAGSRGPDRAPMAHLEPQLPQ
jgi:glycosyltransferase involved in cell wall biosynthesis